MTGKANGTVINAEHIFYRSQIWMSKGFPIPQYLRFCEYLIEHGYHVTLYEARKTNSKYVTVSLPGEPGWSYRVRYSDHPPISLRELRGDCDFFVGKANFCWTNTAAAIKAVNAHFENDFPIPPEFGRPLELGLQDRQPLPEDELEKE